MTRQFDPEATKKLWETARSATLEEVEVLLAAGADPNAVYIGKHYLRIPFGVDVQDMEEWQEIWGGEEGLPRQSHDHTTLRSRCYLQPPS